MVRRNSRVCLFFWRGYSAGQLPSTSMLAAFISGVPFLPSTTSPVTRSEVPSLRASSSASPEALSITICKCLRVVPSLSSIKATFFESLEVLTQPQTVAV